LFSPSGQKLPDQVTVPILLYHHVVAENHRGRYYVSSENFAAQMNNLKSWGYTTITIKQLVNTLTKGSPLPDRPVVITFDDGNLDVYEYAYPIMDELSFIGSVYLVANRLETDGFLQKEQLEEMIASGWEVGSHSMTHADLVRNHDQVRREILQSRLDLNDLLGIEVDTFAYPFGLTDTYISDKVHDYGYRAGLGVGTVSTHSLGTLYYLSRREVQGEFEPDDFARLLPWSRPRAPATPKKNFPKWN
jgi:peptidoglycan/xylan/chitin deacetylase (PgdA/CDA1 family)